MQKHLLLAIFIFYAGNNIFAQVSYNHTLHTGYSTLREDGWPATGPNLGFSPRVNFEINDFISFSISSNLKLLLSMDDEAAAVHLPLYGGFNFGALSTKDNSSKVGGYFNMGYAGVLYSYEDDGIVKGLSGNIGMRFHGGFDIGIMAFSSGATKIRLYALLLGYSF
jgi:hypothetical protein